MESQNQKTSSTYGDIIAASVGESASPEQRLASAVIVQAIDDYQKEKPTGIGKKSYEVLLNKWKKDKATAVEFLFKKNETFDFWCSAARFDPDYLRESIRRELLV